MVRAFEKSKTAFNKKIKTFHFEERYISILRSETWVINDIEKKTLEIFEMQCWRHMDKISWIEGKTNEEVLGIIKEKRTFMNLIRARC